MCHARAGAGLRGLGEAGPGSDRERESRERLVGRTHCPCPFVRPCCSAAIVRTKSSSVAGGGAAPQDKPYPGTIRLAVDATDTQRGIFRVHETIPVQAGPLVLLFWKWLPGNHGPTGAIDKFGGLVIRSGAVRLAWQRDTVDVYAFHVTVRRGASPLDCEFSFLSPVDSGEGRIVMTPEMLGL